MKKEFIMPSMKVKVFDRTILLTDSNPTNSQAAENYAINNAKKSSKRIIAVGTTSCRVLESIADSNGLVKAQEGDTGIFIYPGYKFKCIDNLITNFHLPESTLVMLVSALAGKENIMKAYKEAIKEKYRFFSFGDSMYINMKEK